ncbi:DUF1269 domain-containing protein [Synechococcus sp. PCC 7336]|uniref:DUF1269 domain-containing protein n=1 Tax=Synechococcus sp. PCC 7336 TaxID=195250 RepID=UPI00034884C5|nr:DUF1269 domain-containing protein [Synechococcus sp. PCC 7336]
MSELIAVTFEDKFKAEEVRLALEKMQKQHLLDLEDAVVVVKNRDGKINLKQSYNLVAAGMARGSLWGLAIGLLLFNPILGVATGTAFGAISGAVADIGIDDDFIKELSKTLEPETSALFVLVRKATPDKVLEELKPFQGKILQTSLSKEDEAKLEAALNEAEPVATA